MALLSSFRKQSSSLTLLSFYLFLGNTESPWSRAWGCPLPLQFIPETEFIVLSQCILFFTAPEFGKGKKKGFLGFSQHSPRYVLLKVLSWSVISVFG